MGLCWRRVRAWRRIFHFNALYGPDLAPYAGDPAAGGQIFPLTSVKILPRVLVVDDEGLLRWSVARAQNSSSIRWACAVVTSSGSERHQRCATVWFAFSTTPLRLPRRGGHGRTRTPNSLNLLGWLIFL